FSRSLDEVREEEFLLTNLQRINAQLQRLEADREETRDLLTAPQSTGNTSAAQFQSSAALHQLFSTLLQQDRSKKRGSLSRLSLNASDMIANGPAGQQILGMGSGHRESLGLAQQQQMSSQQRKLSQTQPQTPIRTIPESQHARFGISVRDKVSSGV